MENQGQECTCSFGSDRAEESVIEYEETLENGLYSTVQ